MPVPVAKLTSHALRMLREACKLGLPVYAEMKSPGILYIETKHGSDEYLVFTLLNPEGGETSLVMGKPWDYVTIAVVLLDGSEVKILEERLDQLPYALATSPHVMPDYEADVWSQRLRLVETLEPCGERLLCSRMNPCVRAEVDKYGIRRWIDECTGVVDDATEWQARFGLRPRSR